MAILSTLVTAFGLRKSTVVNDTSINRSRSLLKESMDRFHQAKAGSGRVESFDECVERLHLTKEFLVLRRRQLLIESRLMYGLLVISLLMGGHFATEANLYGVLSALCTGTIGMIGGVTRAFRVHQIDKRELMSFKSFMSASEGWVK